MHLCRVCDGKFIINKLTGHPPAQKPQAPLEEQRNKENILKQFRQDYKSPGSEYTLDDQEFVKQQIRNLRQKEMNITDSNDPLKNVNFL